MQKKKKSKQQSRHATGTKMREQTREKNFVGPIKIETAHQTSHLAAKN